MSGFDDCCNLVGQLTVDGFDLNTPGWQIASLTELWFSHEIRTDSVLLPTAPGQRSYPGRLDESQYELTLFVNGETDGDGIEYSDPWTGLYTNLQLLQNNAILPVGTGRGTRAAVLTLPDQVSTLSADVKFSALRGQEEIEDPTYAVFRTTLTVPAGRFV